MTGSSTQGVNTLLHPVTDPGKATPVYAALLGVEPAHDADYYVGLEAEGQHIGLAAGWWPPSGTPTEMSSGCCRIDEGRAWSDPWLDLSRAAPVQTTNQEMRRRRPWPRGRNRSRRRSMLPTATT